ncbi:MAG TPA: amino acid adenylation domain-containing protein [Kofleriaceae bacterium]|nr:amino acid adenylation domain-containing protein [Kofleriaceae bacterium]
MGMRLVAYIVPRQGRSVSAEALRQFLAARLPEHMLPAVWVELAALPRTPGGKVDRAALAALAAASATAAAPPAAAPARPLTPDEALIASVFAEVLGLAGVGPELDFFASGGHSLLAMRVVARVRALAGVELPVRAVFEARTPAQLALRLGAHAAHRLPPIERAPRERPLRASFAQERLWLLQRVEPDANYNLPAAVHLEGDLDAAALEAALGGVIARHEVLRTRLVADDGIPFQVIEPARPIALPIEDLGDLPEAGRLPAALARAAEDATRGFDLAGAPLWRARLLRLSPRRHVLVLVLHHLLADGWSISVLVRELGALYRAARAGQPARLPDLPAQYADYAAWQRALLAGPRREQLLAYWRDALAGAPPVLALPTDRPRPKAQRFAGARLRYELPDELAARLRALGQREGATLFMTLLAGFAVLLARRAGQRDLVIGTDVAGRDVPEIEPLIGFFVGQLALRVRLEEGASFRAILRRVADTALDAYAHQALPFELLVKELNPARTTSHAPIFQVKMALQEGGPPLALEGLAVSVQELETQSAKLDLTLTWDDTDGRLTGIWEYNADLFDAATIAAYAGELARVLDDAAADPDRAADAPPAPPIAPDLWAAAAARTPAALAIAGGDARLTFAEVEARANQLAHHLVARGVGRGARVGVLLPRSPELIVALLATWKAGAAWVPLDASLPDHRLRFIIEDARPALVIATRAEAERALAGTELLLLDAEGDVLAAHPQTPPARAAGAGDLAYVIYTSGSTGTPKGVMIDHRGLLAYLAWSAAAYNAGAGTGSPVHTSIGFDLTITSVFTPLVQGRPVWLLPDERDPFALLALLRAHRDLTLAKLTPAHLALLGRQLAASPEAAPPPDAVRVLVVGGEALLPEHVAAWRRHLPGAQLVNEYGPTEAVVGCAIFEVPPAAAEGAIPIGAPVPGVQLYVLGEDGARLPRGEGGELYIGGAQLAQGYLGRPGLTAERFVPDPFAPAPGARMYRSGDRARWRADGALEFLGRVDEQIKLNGFRIEPAEIEARLCAHPGVAEAVAIARADEAGEPGEPGEPGDRRLVAYVVPRPGAAPSARALRAFCRDELPEYMVPAAVVMLPALPLTHNGKVDRTALPAPAPEHAGAADAADAAQPPPRTPAEELIAGLAAELLGHPIGPDEDFFVAGGHSLLAAQLMARVDQSFQLELGPRAVFEAPTIAALAARVDLARRAAAGAAADAPALAPAPAPHARAPLSFQQEQLWIVDRVAPDRASYNIPAAVRLDGDLDASALARALGQLAERHAVLRTRLAAGEDGTPHQVIEPARPIALPLEDLGHLPEDARLPAALARATEDARQPFDLAASPLWCARLLRLAPRRHVLVLVLHHTVADGWSIPILVREVAALYRAARAGEPAHLPALPVSYADYAIWQRAWLDAGPRRAHLLEHWRGALAGAPPLLALPTDRPRPREQRFAGARHHLALPDELVARLRQLARREGVTLFMTLLSGFAVLLSRLSGQRDLVIGTPFAGRAPATVEPLIGYFVNLLPLRVDLGGDPSVRELLRRVRQRALDAYAHAALPFELLVQKLAPERDLSAAPLVQVAFAWNQAAPELHLDGLALELLELETDTAKFDLLLSLDEAGDRITGTLEYDRDLFDAATVARLAERLLALLGELTGDTARPARALPLLAPAETQSLIAAWNHVPPSWTRLLLRAPEGACVHDLIERQAAATPDALAITCARQTLDYRALDHAANQVAHGLLALGLPEEGRVGLLLDRSCDFLVAMLGTFKAGGAYVPLEPHLPALRLAQMLEQTDCRILVTEARHRALAEELAEELTGGRPVRTIPDLAAAQPVIRPERPSRPRGLAYVMFTSGSTGTPKGVMIEHAGMLNHLLAKVSDLGLTASDVVAQTTTQGFDVSVWQFLAALLVGGGVAVFSDDEAWEAHRLFSGLERAGATIAETVPAHLRLLLEELDAAPGRYSLAALRWMILNAEALPVELCRGWARHFPAVPLINTYGATECSDDTAHFRVPAQPPAAWRYVPISGSLPRLHAYVLDDQLQPALPGAVGEVFIGGAGVGRGYLGDPARTAERFVPDPFATEPGARCYRTGDLARHVGDGVIEFVGRADHQVKIHGHRVELGEIEAAVASHPEIRDSAVVVREGAGGPRLVAYVVWQPQAITTFDQLGAYLRERLADFMVPTRFVALDALPLSPNGKLDRNALPAPEEPRAAVHVPPRTPLEQALCAIWGELLGTGPISITANFFALGGHSMIAIQTVSRLRRATGHELTVRALFEHPTVAELAAHLERRPPADDAGAAPAAATALPVAGLVRRPPEPEGRHELAVYQLPEWYLHALEPDSPFYNVSLDAVLTGELDVDAFVLAWRALIARHAALRTTFASERGRPVQRIREHLPLERADVYVDRRQTPAAEVPAEMARLVEAWSNELFDFERGPLFRVRLAAFPERRFLFVFAAHHIIWDETSTMNMVGELAELYNARRAGRPAQLPALELEYTDFAAWINRALAAGELQAQRRYWLGKLAPPPPALELPTDAPRPPRQRFTGDTVSVWLPAELTRRLDEVLRAEGLTLYIFLLAVLDLHLHRLSGQRDFVVGTPVANRDDVRLEPLLGLFATALPLRATIAPGMTFRALLAQARATALEAYDHHNYPSILAIQELNPAIDPSRSRLFSVMYGVQNNKTRLLSELAFDGLSLSFADSHARAEAQTARFDLTYIVDQLDDRIALQLNYDRDLFTRESAERMVAQFLGLVGEALAHPDRPLDRFAMVSPAERQRLVSDLNQTAAALGPARAVHELFFDEAARAPAAPALVQGTTTLTYADVAALAERWAARLAALGVGPEDRVALWLDASIEWVVAALAILRAGAAYVAIAPDQPPARSLAIVAQAGARLVLTAGSVALPLLPDGVRAIAMDREWSAVATAPAPAPAPGTPPAVAPDQLAYIAFTSGTTGEPKGIEITHRGVVNIVRATDRDYRLGPADAALFLTSPGFDASVLDVFWPLATGARVVLLEVCGARSDPRAIARLVRAHGVSLLQCVPVMLQSLVEGRLGGALPELPSLRLVIAGGAALPRPLAERFARALPGCALGNHYGPTEVTVDAARRDALLPTRQAIVPIGRPVANARIYVLDARGELAPAGVTGELYVASPGLARGYRGDPARTAAAFVPDPFGPPGGRLYRTGDLGRVGEGGELEFLGRVDKQVKIRGHRVELLDLEAALHAHPAVRSCAVRVVSGETGGEALGAYVELTAAATAVGEVRMFTLAQRPELQPALEALHLEAWPAFFAGDASLGELWPRLPAEYPQHQFALVDAADAVLAAGNSVPLVWDGSLADLPSGWTDGLRRAFAAKDAGRRPDTLFILTGVAAQDAQGRGLSTILLRGFRALARALGLARVLVAVRPTGKAEHPEIDFAAWCTHRRADGQLEDNWLRAHERVGARILAIAPRSQSVRGSIADWERWTGRAFPRSGEYDVPGALAKVRIDREAGIGEYDEPAVWLQHADPARDDSAWAHVDPAALREHLRARLPAYMVPEHLRIVAAMPLQESGKIDERALPPLSATRTARRRVPLAGPVQEQLGEIWRAILGCGEVGASDDFFDLGGHSIRAAEVISRIHDAFGVQVPVRELYRVRTIAALEPLVQARSISAPAAMLPPPAASLGRGTAHGHHGEILQGVFGFGGAGAGAGGGEPRRALVTLPCAIFHSEASFEPALEPSLEPGGAAALTVDPDWRCKALRAAELTLAWLGQRPDRGRLQVRSNIPVGWGLGSSTSDVIAAIHAVAAAFHRTLDPRMVAHLAVEAETASDATMFCDQAVLFAHRDGEVLESFGRPLPPLEVLGFNTDAGGVDTLRTRPAEYSWQEIEAFRPLLGLLRRAVEAQSPRLVAQIATASARISQRHLAKPAFAAIEELAAQVGALGIQVAHSGTVVGLLFDPERNNRQRIARAEEQLARAGLGPTWHFVTDSPQGAQR